VTSDPFPVLSHLDPRRPWRHSPFWLKLIEVAALVVGVSALGHWLAYGARFPDWLEAVSTLAAVLAAMYAGLYAANAWKLEIERETRWVQQQQREQAGKVAGWPGELRRHVIGQDATGGLHYGGYEGLDIVLRNASDVPVTRVWADVTLIVDVKSSASVRIPFGAKEVARILEPATHPVTKYVGADTVVDPSTYKPGGVEIDYWCEIILTFRDASGRDWKRLADGQLLLVQGVDVHDD
jgi:hypothetical protein